MNEQGMRRRVGFLLTLATVVACMDARDEPEDGAFRIINGDPAASAVPEYAATVALHHLSGSVVSIDHYCSGVLIADDVVMTAAHCCDENGNANSPNYDPYEPQDVAVYFGDGPAFIGGVPNGVFHSVTEVLVHPDFDRKNVTDDLCLLRLTNPTVAAAPVPTLPAVDALTNADAGTDLDHVGFGYSDLAKTQDGVKLHGLVPLAAMGCTLPGCPPGAPVDTQFSYSQTGTGLGPCDGDSGGPAYVDRGGVQYVAGIASYGDAACNAWGVSTHVAPYETFIGDFVGPGGGGTGGGSTSGGSDGGGSSGGVSCGDGVCDIDESCDGRYGTISCIADCPGQLGGKPSARFCYVGGVCEGPGCP